MSDLGWFNQTFGSGVAKTLVRWADGNGGSKCVPLDYDWLVQEFEFTEKQLRSAAGHLVAKEQARIESADECNCGAQTHLQLLPPSRLAWEAAQREAAAERAAQRARKIAARGGQINRAKIPDVVKARVYARDNFTCQECGTANDLTLDHIEPWSTGGPDTVDNLRVLCRPCNSRKGDRS